MSIGQNIKTIRKEKKITQKKLAEGTGIAEATIVRYEKERFIPTIKQVEKIADFLEVTPYDIMGVDYWNQTNDTESLSKEIHDWEQLPPYDMDDMEVFKTFLSLNPDGKEKASEYIEFLMYKQNQK